MWFTALRSCPCDWENVAVTCVFCPPASASWQLCPLHAPLKPEKLEPAAGAAVRLTVLPPANEAVHVPGQLIPAGVLVTVPLPETVTVSWAADVAEKVAETDSLLASTSLQVAPLHAPPNPAKFDPESALAVSVTAVPFVKLAAQLPGQLMPAGALVTVPLPVSATINCA
jgi:hypothetical protein